MLRKRDSSAGVFVNFVRLLKTLKNTTVRLLLDKIRINMKYNYILPHFIQFSKQMLLFIAVEDNIQKEPFAVL